MIPKPLGKIERQDIEALATEQVRESRMLEYKRDIQLSTDEHKRELARDVSSFANAAGGDLIFGVEEAKGPEGKNLGYPAKIIGVECSNFEATRLRFESIVRDNIDPRIPGITFHKVDGFERGPVIIVRLPQSWLGPHMVTFSNQTHFYSRNSSGKQGLDVREIRAAFLGTAEVATKIRAFRDERIGRILADETPMKLRDDGAGRLVVHAVPVAGPGGAAIDVIQLSRAAGLRPLAHSDNWSGRLNMDGYVAFSGPKKELQRCYSQVFRNGAFEGVTEAFMNPSRTPPQLQALIVESVAAKGADHYVRLLRSSRFDGPIVLMVTLMGVHGAHIYNEKNDWTHPQLDGRFTIDKAILTLPDVLIEDAAPNVRSLLKPSFDALWQASGRERSLGYTEEGQWDEQAHG